MLGANWTVVRCIGLVCFGYFFMGIYRSPDAEGAGMYVWGTDIWYRWKPHMAGHGWSYILHFRIHCGELRKEN